MTAGFAMSAETAEKFFRLCLEREAVTQAERLHILNELFMQEEAMPMTELDIKLFSRDIKTKGGKVLTIKSRPPKRNGGSL